MMKGIPTVIMVSRETGKIIEARTEDVSREDFRRICQALTKRKEAEDGLYSGADCGNSGGNP